NHQIPFTFFICPLISRTNMDTRSQHPGVTLLLHQQTRSGQRSKRLTVKLIENLKPGPKPYEVPDGDGLYLTVRPNGSKSFNLRYRFGGKARNLTLGLSAVGLAKARELAREALVELARGN